MGETGAKKRAEPFVPATLEIPTGESSQNGTEKGGDATAGDALLNGRHSVAGAFWDANFFFGDARFRRPKPNLLKSQSTGGKRDQKRTQIRGGGAAGNEGLSRNNRRDPDLRRVTGRVTPHQIT